MLRKTTTVLVLATVILLSSSLVQSKPQRFIKVSNSNRRHDLDSIFTTTTSSPQPIQQQQINVTDLLSNPNFATFLNEFNKYVQATQSNEKATTTTTNTTPLLLPQSSNVIRAGRQHYQTTTTIASPSFIYQPNNGYFEIAKEPKIKQKSRRITTKATTTTSTIRPQYNLIATHLNTTPNPIIQSKNLELAVFDDVLEQSTPLSRESTVTTNNDNNDFDEALFRKQAETAQYKFASNVDDTINGNLHEREEVRDGLNVRGKYSYSDGFYKRTVHYEADDKGYRVIK